MKKIIILLIMFGIVLLQSAVVKIPPAQVAVSPALLELAYDPHSKTEAITFFNYSDRTIHATISLSNWTLDGNGKTKITPPTPQSLDQWILITPLNFTVKPKDRQTIRFAIRARAKPAAGEHRAMIWIDEVLPSNAKNDGMRAKFRFGIPVYLAVQPAKADGRLQGMQVKAHPGSLNILFVCVNKGNLHDRMDGTISLWKAGTPLSQKERDEILLQNKKSKYLVLDTRIPGEPVFPKQKRTISTRLNVPKKGRYLLYVKGHFANGNAFVKEKTVTIPAAK